MKEKEKVILENKLFNKKRKESKRQEDSGKKYQDDKVKKEYQNSILKEQKVEKFMDKVISSKDEEVSEREYLGVHCDSCKAKLYQKELESESRWRGDEHKKHWKKKVFQERGRLERYCNCKGCRNYKKMMKIRSYCEFDS